MKIPFAEWTPDASDFGSAGTIEANNVFPSANGFQPFPSLNVLSDALPLRPLGGIEAFDKNDVNYQYIGTASKLYELSQILGWTDVTNTGGDYSSTERWNFVRWKNKILAVNWDNNPQQITMGAANFSDLTAAFKARNLTVLGDFVVASNTTDSTDGNVPNRVRWSGINDETSWTVSPSTLSDYRDLTTGGPIRKIVGGEVGIIVSDTSIFRMDFIGSPVVFQIDEVQPDVGTLSAGSVTNIGDTVYLLDRNGFIELTSNGTSINRIGAGKVDRFILEDLDHTNLDRISSIADPVTNRVMWAYPSKSATSGAPNKIIIYDRIFGKWSLVTENIELIISSRGIGITLDELELFGYTDLDAMTISLDSPELAGNFTSLAAINSDFKLGYFRGPNKTAVMETAEIELNEGRRTSLNKFSPIVDGGTVTGQMGKRDRQTDAVVYGSSLNQSASGHFSERSSARYHRIKLTVTGSDWKDALGVYIDPQDARPAGGRP